MIKKQVSHQDPAALAYPTELSAGKRFQLALHKEKPLQVVGAVNAYCALMAEKAGYRAQTR